MREAPRFCLTVSRRWCDDLARWLASPAGQGPSRRFSGAALEAEVCLLVDEELYGAGMPAEAVLPWLQRYARALSDLQRSRATTVVVPWQRSGLELHLTRTGNTEALLSLHGAPAGRSVWRLPVSLGALREALGEVTDGMVAALEGMPSGPVADELADWLAGLTRELESSAVVAPLSVLRLRRDPRVIEIATSDSGGRSLVTRLRFLEPALVYAGESMAHGGTLVLGGEATLAASFGGSRRWEGAVLQRWQALGEQLLRQPPDGAVPGSDAEPEAEALLPVEPLTVGELASLVGEHLSGLVEALLREQPLLEVHEGFAALRAMALSLRRHGSGRWQPLVPVDRPRAVAARPAAKVEREVAPARLRQMGYHRHWTVSLPPSSGRGSALVWGEAVVAVTSPRGVEVTRLATGEQRWRSEQRSRGRWFGGGGGLFGAGDDALLRLGWLDGGASRAEWPIPSDRLAAASPVANGALVLSESGLLGRWSDAAGRLAWTAATAVIGAGHLVAGGRSALVLGAGGEAAVVSLARGTVRESWLLPWAVRTVGRVSAQVWVEGYAEEVVLIGVDGASRSARLAVEGEVAALWEMADGSLGRLSEGAAGWLFEVWSLSGAAPERRCLLRLDADLVAGRNLLPLADGLLIAVRDGLIRFGVEQGRVVERWRRPLGEPDAVGPVRLVADPAQGFVVELGGQVTVRALQTGRILHQMPALWEQASEARLAADGSLFVVEPAGRGGSVLHGLPAPGWLGLVD